MSHWQLKRFLFWFWTHAWLYQTWLNNIVVFAITWETHKVLSTNWKVGSILYHTSVNLPLLKEAFTRCPIFTPRNIFYIICYQQPKLAHCYTSFGQIIKSEKLKSYLTRKPFRYIDIEQWKENRTPAMPLQRP